MSNTAPRPPIKWAGGKTALVPQLLERFPPTWNAETDLYIEPFVGGGALFFALHPQHAILNDANERLIKVYAGVRDHVEDLIEALLVRARIYSQGPEGFYASVRRRFDTPLEALRRATVGYTPSIAMAADFIFLNKTCFNGLYRVNKNNEFNVPWGKNPKATICDAENLRLCSAALRDADLRSDDFASVLPVDSFPDNVVIYCDPPYCPVSKTSDFTAYTPGGFTYADQIRLLARAVEWKRQGAHVILSQAADESLIDQYRRCGFTCDKVRARRNVNSVAAGRGCVDEYIIVGTAP